MKYQTDLENHCFAVSSIGLVTIVAGILVWIFKRKKK